MMKAALFYGAEEGIVVEEVPRSSIEKPDWASIDRSISKKAYRLHEAAEYHKTRSTAKSLYLNFPK